MRRFFITISDPAFERLRDLAFQERRYPREQAAWLVEQALFQRPTGCPARTEGQEAAAS